MYISSYAFGILRAPSDYKVARMVMRREFCGKLSSDSVLNIGGRGCFSLQ